MKGLLWPILGHCGRCALEELLGIVLKYQVLKILRWRKGRLQWFWGASTRCPLQYVFFLCQGLVWAKIEAVVTLGCSMAVTISTFKAANVTFWGSFLGKSLRWVGGYNYYNSSDRPNMLCLHIFFCQQHFDVPFLYISFFPFYGKKHKVSKKSNIGKKMCAVYIVGFILARCAVFEVVGLR